MICIRVNIIVFIIPEQIAQKEALAKSKVGSRRQWVCHEVILKPISKL